MSWIRKASYVRSFALAFVILFSERVSAEPCLPGQVIGEMVEQYGEKLSLRMLEASRFAREGASLTAAEIRRLPGTSKMSAKLFEPEVLIRGSDKNAGLVPWSIGKKLEGRSFSSFDKFREEFWLAVADSRFAEEFRLSNRTLMKQGMAPASRLRQQTSRGKVYQLHHIRPISQGGDVYDTANIMIVSPRFHEEVLSPQFHNFSPEGRGHEFR